MCDEEADDLREIEEARLAVDQGKHDDAEGLPQRGVLEEEVDYALGQDIAAQFDDDAHAVLVGIVVERRDAVYFLGAHQLRDMLDETGLVHLIGQFGDDDGVFAVVHRLDLHLRLHDDAPAPGTVGFLRALRAENHSRRSGKSGPGTNFRISSTVASG